MIGPLRIQRERFWFASSFGPHLAVWLFDRARGLPQGFARYTWNWRGQATGVRSIRDFEEDPIAPSPQPKSVCRFGGNDELCSCSPGNVHPDCNLSEMRAHMGEATIDRVMPDRPSRHGKLLGEALAAMAEDGRFPGAPDLCATCAFRAGSIPNQTAGTALLALNIILGIDTDNFACHHGMMEGRPTRLCVGALLAKRADCSVFDEQMARLRDELDAMSGDDEIRLAFDRWWISVDPDLRMDVYELASVYARSRAEVAHA